MTQRTRYFLVGSALVVMVGLCTGLVAYYNGNLSLGVGLAGRRVGLPAGRHDGVAYADVRAIMNSEFRQKLRAVLPTGRGQGRASARDRHRHRAGHRHGRRRLHRQTSRCQAAGVVLVRGRFNDGQIEALGDAARRARSRHYKGKRMLADRERSAHAGGGGPSDAGRPAAAAVAFLEPGSWRLATWRRIKQAIDARRRSRRHQEHRTDEARERRRRARNAWVGRPVRRDREAASLPDADQGSTCRPCSGSPSARTSTAASTAVRAEARDDQSAEDLRAIVNGGLAAGRLMAGQDRELDAC